MRHHGSECGMTLRGNITIDEIEHAGRMCRHDLEQAAESAALAFLGQYGPMPRWQLTRLIMDRGHDWWRADRAVKLLIIGQRIAYDNGARQCSLVAQAPRGWFRRLVSAIASV